MIDSGSYDLKIVVIIILVAIISSLASLIVMFKYNDRLKHVELNSKNTIPWQQGMTLKYIKQGDQYIHTLMEGQLLAKMGLTLDMVMGKNLHEFYSKKDAAAIEHAYSKAWNGDITTYEAHLNGIDYFVTLSPVKQKGKVIEVIGSGVDISERKKAEQILHESLALRRTLIDSLEIGMVVIDHDRKIMAVNRPWCHMFKIEEPIRDIIGRDIFEQLHVHFQHKEAVVKKLDEIMVNKLPYVDEVNQFENRIFKRSYFPFYMDGELKGHIWALEDITERKAMERGIIETKEEAVKASNAKSEFLSRMSHELRTPLNSILGFSQLLELDETLTCKQQQFVREIINGGTHLLTLINDVLDLTAIEAGKLKVAIGPLRIGNVINQCIQFVAPLAEKNGISLTIAVTAEEKHVVSADNIRLRQILLNLLDNAIKYNRENGTVLIQCEVQDDLLYVHIIDSGIGIPVAEQQQVFEPFYRSGRVNVQGTGIGLSLVSQLIHLMDGKVGVKSSNEGSDFWISLPLVHAPAANDQKFYKTTSQLQLQDHNITILYIEDNLLNFQLVKEILATIPGIDLISAATGSEGVTVAAERRPDVILLDLNLPDLNGYEVLAKIKANPGYEQTPIIAVSANAMPEEIKYALASGFVEYITKPIDIPAFLSLLAKYVIKNDTLI
ncbi:ATP-binding protein [Neobacillus drentensis]|uniref:ATP-binding protein n=1 Tax=Neobacillus drentensis TaxID=220684 RepID=UPI002FFE1751